MSHINLTLAKNLIESAEKKANEIKVPMVISIVDEGGNFVACHRMDDALLVSVELAQNKAWTSIAMKMTTENLALVAANGKELYGINTTNNGRVVVFGGGIPLYNNGQIIGAVGVSGGSVDEDIRVAQSAVDALYEFKN
ncbi:MULTISPECIES: GlcG/HbpS family heme-binding protein [Peribacillus]|uniref:GlcG/HbpS family heme-binding protein n=1 Tax=Peribacillus TaxID=2675229 RepID=UPI00167F6696|nr:MULTISPECIES: heme-binding protein [Peribacillus]MBK5442854.1 heme-binding protein [Peribacillus sp. TH24]MBK5484257.1 heme-binding protein [Peribacillus sp. TH16]MBK5500557.1 heme-binding protein [Peribacillus sp. TH14]QNU03729.1 heme-binding protein [Peribacillus butanolivorans]